MHSAAERLEAWPVNGTVLFLFLFGGGVREDAKTDGHPPKKQILKNKQATVFKSQRIQLYYCNK